MKQSLSNMLKRIKGKARIWVPYWWGELKYYQKLHLLSTTIFQRLINEATTRHFWTNSQQQQGILIHTTTLTQIMPQRTCNSHKSCTCQVFASSGTQQKSFSIKCRGQCRSYLQTNQSHLVKILRIQYGVQQIYPNKQRCVEVPFPRLFIRWHETYQHSQNRGHNLQNYGIPISKSSILWYSNEEMWKGYFWMVLLY